MKTLGARGPTQKGLELVCHVAPRRARRDRRRPEPAAADPRSTWSATRSSSPSAARSRSTCASRRSPTGEVALHFAVRDTGIGIPADKQHADLRGVHAGRRLDHAAATAAPGSGWRSARSWSRMMGGRIWVESDAGQGSTFHFTARFGCAEPRPPTTAHPADLSRPAGPDRRRQRDQPPHPGRALARLGHAADRAWTTGRRR